MTNAVPSFGDNVRIRNAPETESRGLAGLSGQVTGVTTPSVTGVAVIGASSHDVAFTVTVLGQTEAIWFCPELVELVDHAPGTEITLDGAPKKWIRTEDGAWREEPTGERKKWWELWK